MLHDARAYRALGLSIIPVGRDKHPLVRWEVFQRELPHPDQIDEWWQRWPEANIGTVTGKVSGLVVLDADGPDGLTSLARLGTTALTWLSKTGRTEGGWQQFFKHPGDDLTIGNRAALRPGLDVRGDGGYVILPPSLHASGRRYEWLTPPTAVSLAPIPSPVLDLLLTPPAPPIDPTGAEIPQGRRNATLYRLARSLVAKGLTAAAVAAALLAENHARCKPPLPDAKVRELAAHATTQPDRPDFRNERPPPPTATLRPLGIGLGTFLLAAKDLPPTESYIDGILSSDGGGWIAGEEKLGKTYYADEEALCLALGLSVCGRFAVPTRRRVLFIEEEDSPRRVNVRLRALLRGHGLDPEDPALLSELDAWFAIEVWSGFSLDDPTMLARLEAAIVESRPAVVYIDVLRKVTLRDLNKAAEAGALLAELDSLRRRYGVVFRVLHHYRKVQGFRAGRGSQEIGGSYVLGAWAENSLYFEPVGRTYGVVKLQVQSKDGPALPPFRLTFQTEGPAHAPTIVKLSAQEDRDMASEIDEIVYQAIATLPQTDALAGKPGVDLAAIATATKRPPRSLRRVIKRLEDAERIVVTGLVAKQKHLYGVND